MHCFQAVVLSSFLPKCAVVCPFFKPRHCGKMQTTHPGVPRAALLQERLSVALTAVVAVGHILGSLFRSTARSMCSSRNPRVRSGAVASHPVGRPAAPPVQPSEDGFILCARLPLSRMLSVGFRGSLAPTAGGVCACHGASREHGPGWERACHHSVLLSHQKDCTSRTRSLKLP